MSHKIFMALAAFIILFSSCSEKHELDPTIKPSEGNSSILLANPLNKSGYTLEIQELKAASSETYINIAKGKPIFASNSYGSTYSANKANDGDLNTMWGSDPNFTGTNYIYIDLGLVQTINGVGFNWDDYYSPSSYELYLSNDAQNWQHVLSLDNSFSNTPELYGTAQARFIGIVCNSGSNGAVGLKEFEVYRKLDAAKRIKLNIESVNNPSNYSLYLVGGNGNLYVDYGNGDEIEAVAISGKTPLVLPYTTANFYEMSIYGDIEMIETFKYIPDSFGSHQIRNASFSAATNLKRLTLHQAGTSLLDIKGNQKLERLYLSHGTIGSLDLSYNPLLNFLACEYQNIKEIDLSMLPLLDTLALAGNQLNEIDLSLNPQISILSLEDNAMDSLDVSNLSDLTYLRAYNNKIQTIKIGASNGLEYIDVHSNHLSIIDLSASSFPMLNKLDVSNNFLMEINTHLGTNIINYAPKLIFSCEDNYLTGPLSVYNAFDVRCASNYISALHLFACQDLNSLFIFNNSLLSEYTTDIVTDQAPVEWIYIYETMLPDATIDKILDNAINSGVTGGALAMHTMPEPYSQGVIDKLYNLENSLNWYVAYQ